MRITNETKAIFEKMHNRELFLQKLIDDCVPESKREAYFESLANKTSVKSENTLLNAIQSSDQDRWLREQVKITTTRIEKVISDLIEKKYISRDAVETRLKAAGYKFIVENGRIAIKEKELGGE